MPTANENAAPPRSILMRILIRSWEYRHPRVWAGGRTAGGAALMVLAIILLAYGRRYGWATLVLVASALNFWIGYLLRTIARSPVPRT